jgi:hypothetical protein
MFLRLVIYLLINEKYKTDREFQSGKSINKKNLDKLWEVIEDVEEVT